MKHGLLKEGEAELITSEIEVNINKVLLCDQLTHPGEIMEEEVRFKNEFLPSVEEENGENIK